jgi:hypothetical protein
MLGKASEGAWMELGESLIACVPKGKEASVAKQRIALEDPQLGVMKKIDAILHVFNHADVGPVLKAAVHLDHRHLNNAAQWTDSVRDSRNTIHFGVTPAVPITHETVSVLMLAALPRLRELYLIKAEADKHRA